MNMHATIVNDVVQAPLKNVAALATLVESVRERSQLSSGFGLFYGPSGYGKSRACEYARDNHDCLYVEVFDFWGRKELCRAVLSELGRTPKGTIADMMSEIGRHLGQRVGCGLIIDEADKLVDKNMIEMARDIQRLTNAPVILVGEESLPQKLAVYERCENRVLDFGLAQPCDVQDARILAGLIAPGIEIDGALIEKICQETRGRTRRVANTLLEIANYARNRGERAVTAAGYRGHIFNGVAPRRGA
ncbi:AAA family ATPase [Methylobacterium aquaticum]|uniref:AAA family ATPase n=1 Tax=Methylobacterium aquaticum TaxID=270351 RepID=UPI003D17C2E1